MNPYLEFVEYIEHGISKARGYSIFAERHAGRGGPTVLLFSPHPDDECITGLLPLRLMREAGRRIINVPVTFGSDRTRQPGRLAELEAACGYLGFEVYRASTELLPLTVEDVARVLEDYQPEIIFMPHAQDWNSGHVATHELVMTALQQLDAAFCCHVVETEFWSAMDDPNLLVEGDAKLVADLVAATSLHAGEVERNPYHLMLPAWMQDNVRRGSELVGGEGGAAFDYSFATVYRLRRWENGGLLPSVAEGKGLPLSRNPADFFHAPKNSGA